ncbi:MAG: ubiquinone/menaquinone biosynthesis methyltransferase, partial [Pseudomonadota bacterium]
TPLFPPPPPFRCGGGSLAARDRVTICDLTPEMVAVARERAAKLGLDDRVRCSVGNAESLPIADRSVDIYTIAFGLRNVTRIDAALAEAHRVLRPGGRFFCLEFSRVVIPPLRRAYERYSDIVIPRLGRIVAKDEDSYRYLVESIRRFPSQKALATRMGAAGLSRVGYQNLSGGIAAIHHGWRL